MAKLSEFQLDALTEVCSMGTAYAATAVSVMIDRKINMSVPGVKLIPLAQVPQAVGNPEELVVGVYCRILGDLSGGFVLTFPEPSAFALCDVLLDKPVGTTKTLNEMEVSVMQETGNIIAGAFVSVLARIMQKGLMISVPRIAIDMAGAIIDVILIEIAEVADEVVVMEIVFSDESKHIQGKFFILPDPRSLELLMAAVEKTST